MSIEILDSGACKAMGVLDVTAIVNPARAFTAGIRQIISSGLDGRVRLVLEEGIGQHELVAHVTPLPPAIGAGLSPSVQWIDDFTIDIETRDTQGLLAAAQVRFSFYRALNLAQPSVVAPPLNPFQIMGADLIGWWRATSVIESGGKISQANDLSGNGRDAVQATAANQPGISANGGPNGTPAFVFDGTGVVIGTAKRLSVPVGAVGLVPGDFPALFVVQQMDLATCANLCQTLGIRDTVTLNPLQLERRNTVPPGHFGANSNLAGSVGGFDGPIVLDGAPHLQSLLLSALHANCVVDNVAGADKVTTGGLLSPGPYSIEIGGSTTFAGNSAFSGLIMDAWLTRILPSPAQLALLNSYVRNLYGIPIP